MENQEGPKINITRKDKSPITITKKVSPEILITQKITDTLTIENVFPLNTNKFAVSLKNREDIRKIVEIPLVEACEIFWDKNIRTVETSANQDNIQSGCGYILLDWESLSDENKKIAQLQNGNLREAHGGAGTFYYDLKIPLTKNMLVKDLSQNAAKLAHEFQKQKLVWVSGETLDDKIAQIEKDRSIFKDATEDFNKEITRLKQPGVWEAECKGYFDSKTQTCWDSEELFKKSLEDYSS